MSQHIIKRHNKSLLLYHLVCPVKYRRKVFNEQTEKTLRKICLGIELRYEIYFVEIGVDDDHVHFLLQSVPSWSPSSMVQAVKSITAKLIFRVHPYIKEEILWGGEFWTDGYYINTVSKHANEDVIKNYVREQGMDYKMIYKGQPRLF